MAGDVVKDLSIFKNSVPFNNSGAGYTATSAYDADGIYIVNYDSNRGPGEVFITNDLKHSIFGGQVINAMGEKIEKPMDIASYLDKANFVFNKGDGTKKQIVLFTDSSCPYCKTAEKGIFDSNDVSASVFLFPLNFHLNAVTESIYSMMQTGKEMEALVKIADGDKSWRSAQVSLDELTAFQTKLRDTFVSKKIDDLKFSDMRSFRYGVKAVITSSGVSGKNKVVDKHLAMEKSTLEALDTLLMTLTTGGSNFDTSKVSVVLNTVNRVIRELTDSPTYKMEAKLSLKDYTTYKSKIEDTIALGEKLGVRGTPTIVDAKTGKRTNF